MLTIKRLLMSTPSDNKKSKIKVTEKDRKKYGVCEHDSVSYKALEKLNKLLYKRVKSDQECFQRLSYDIYRKGTFLEEYKQLNRSLVDKYEDIREGLEKELEEANKKYYDMVRAYNGLAQLGRFAQDMGIDIEKANLELPENSKGKFEHKATLMESGKVKQSLKFKPNGEDK